ncbi:MAG: hypothetical protein ABI851_08340 [Saprospiraceae bacterium]
MKGRKHRKVVYFKDYFKEFFKKQTIVVKKKIVWALELIEDLEYIPETYLNHIT